LKPERSDRNKVSLTMSAAYFWLRFQAFLQEEKTQRELNRESRELRTSVQVDVRIRDTGHERSLQKDRSGICRHVPSTSG
jgi:hypothetical protein